MAVGVGDPSVEIEVGIRPEDGHDGPVAQVPSIGELLRSVGTGLGAVEVEVGHYSGPVLQEFAAGGAPPLSSLVGEVVRKGRISDGPVAYGVGVFDRGNHGWCVMLCVCLPLD